MALLERIARFSMRHEKAVAVLGFVWFWAGIAIYAEFIKLPDLPEIAVEVFFWLSVAFNASWWGYAKPAIDRKRAQLAQLEEDSAN